MFQFYFSYINTYINYMIKKNSPQNDKQSDLKSTKKDITSNERVNSCFSKKGNNKTTESTQIKHSLDNHRGEDIEEKKKTKNQKRKIQKNLKSIKEKQQEGVIKENQVETLQQKQAEQIQQNIINQQNYGQDCAKQLSNLIIENIQRRDNKNEDKKSHQSHQNIKNEDLISSCSVQTLKRIKCNKIQDSDFFLKNEHHNSSKRLLILQYKDQQVYINQNKFQKNQISKVPQTIKDVFHEKKYPFFNAFPQIRVSTEQTYDTSNPSSYSNHFTPSSLTPRSNQARPSVRQRTNSYNNQLQINYLNPIQHHFDETNKYDYEQYYNNDFQYYNNEGKNVNRKRRIISFEQSKAYIIDISKIETDGRTTVMIRNIPNKYTYDMLLDLINRNNKKKFDFFYLPIDYSNSCNMGYAFINFLHTKFIKDFYKEFNGQKWEKFNSEKICSLSYARIQGTLSLISHFENAGVMYQKQRKIRPLIDVDEEFMNNLSTIISKQKQQN